MLPDDVYRSRLESVIASLKYWVPGIADVARVEVADTPDFYRLSAAPKLAKACPFELIVRADQHYDLQIAGESYVDRATQSLDMFLILVQAIADGRVVQRRWVSLATGTLRRIETIIALKGGAIWQAGRDIAGPTDLADEAVESHDVHFLPYHR